MAPPPLASLTPVSAPAPLQITVVVEASHAKVTYAAALKRNPVLPFSHTFGLNMTFCHCIVASSTVYWLSCSASNHRTWVRFALGLQLRGMEEYGG